MRVKAERKQLLVAFRSYLSFFLLMAFIITCCIMLFTTQLQKATGTGKRNRPNGCL